MAVTVPGLPGGCGSVGRGRVRPPEPMPGDRTDTVRRR